MTKFAVEYKTSKTGQWYRLPLFYEGFFDAERHCKRLTFQTSVYAARVVSIDENGHKIKRKAVIEIMMPIAAILNKTERVKK